MRTGVRVAAVALLVFLNPLLARPSDDLILPPKAIAPPDSLVSNWMEECKAKGTPKACYNVAVFYAQVKGDEPKAIEYLRPLCQKDYGLGCFNLGGLVIKEKATRHEGILAFKRACGLSKSASGTEEANQWTASACRYADVVQQYEDLDYMLLAVKLGLSPAPPSSTKSETGAEARFKAEIVQPVGDGETQRLQKLALIGVAYSGHRDHSDRRIVITSIGHRDRSEATLAGPVTCSCPSPWSVPGSVASDPLARDGGRC